MLYFYATLNFSICVCDIPELILNFIPQVQGDDLQTLNSFLEPLLCREKQAGIMSPMPIPAKAGNGFPAKSYIIQQMKSLKEPLEKII